MCVCVCVCFGALLYFQELQGSYIMEDKINKYI